MKKIILTVTLEKNLAYLLLESVSSIFPSLTCLKSVMAPAWLNPRVGALLTDKISSPET